MRTEKTSDRSPKEAIKSKTDYDEENNELLIYENSDNSLGDISIRLEPWESDESAITVITEIEFCYPYNQYVDDGELDLILYAKTDYRYNVEFSLGKYFFDSSSSHTLFAYIFGAKVGEDYEKGSDKYQVIGTTTYENNNDCPWTKGDFAKCSSIVYLFSPLKARENSLMKTIWISIPYIRIIEKVLDGKRGAL